MYFALFKNEATKLERKLLQILETKNGTLTNNRDKSNLVKFYCALQEYGHQILTWEVETFEIVLGNKGFGYDEIMNVVGMVYLVENGDYVLSNRDHFENAVQLLNDILLNTATTELQPPHYITWAIFGILVLFRTDNLPIIGDAANFIIESFKKFGWTLPPFFFSNTHLKDGFEPLPKEYLDIIKRSTFRELATKAISIKEPANGFENYLKHHAPIIKYIDERLRQTHREVDSILNKG